MYRFSGGFDIDVSIDKDATVASARFENRIFTASSKRNPADKYNEEIGVDLAVARLFGKISRYLARRANGAVKHADDMRRERARRARSAIPYRISVADVAAALSQQPQGRHARQEEADAGR